MIQPSGKLSLPDFFMTKTCQNVLSGVVSTMYLKRYILKSILSIFIYFFTITMPPTVRSDDKKETPAIIGTWQLEYDYNGNSITDKYEIKSGKDGTLTGRILRDGKEITTLEKFKVEGKKVTFEAKGTTDGTNWTAEFSCTVDGDEIDGMVKIGANDQSFDLPWKPKRVKVDPKS
jgi:hypothetical protein